MGASFWTFCYSSSRIGTIALYLNIRGLSFWLFANGTEENSSGRWLNAARVEVEAKCRSLEVLES
jgi:hypothetical protein